MIKITIDEKEYFAPQDWSEMTLGKFIELCNIPIPDKLRNLWVASALDPPDDEAYKKADDEIGTEETFKIFPDYFGKVMGCLTDIPQDIIDRTDGPLRAEFFNAHLRHFIYSSFARYPVHIVNGKLEMYDPPYKTSFVLNDVVYYLPRDLKVYGESIPLGRERAITFTEASDIEVALRNMAEGAAERLPMFVAIYCRPEETEYSEEGTLAREKLFMDLSMEEVWRVFFCIYRQLGKYQNFIREYSKRAVELLPERLTNLG
jgi:hypothetical protein